MKLPWKKWTFGEPLPPRDRCLIYSYIYPLVGRDKEYPGFNHGPLLLPLMTTLSPGDHFFWLYESELLATLPERGEK